MRFFELLDLKQIIQGEQSLKNEGGEACGSLRTVHLDITNQESVEKALVFTEMQLSGSLRKLIASVGESCKYYSQQLTFQLLQCIRMYFSHLLIQKNYSRGTENFSDLTTSLP